MSGHEFQSYFPESGHIDYDDTSTNITETTLDEMRSIAARYPQARSALGPALEAAQQQRGYLPGEAMAEVGARFDREPM